MRRALILALVAMAVLPGAAQAQKAPATKPATKKVPAPKRQRDLITRVEILKAHEDQDLFVAIKALRPHFLIPPRGVRTLGYAPLSDVAVYVDGIRQIGVESLRTMMGHAILEVRYLDPAKSQNEFGITANAGAIVIKRWETLADSVTRKPPR
jgi:hypothetical protein